MFAPQQAGVPANVQFARNRIMQARQQGILPTNFQVAQTPGNILGQYKALNPAINQARVSTTPSAAHQLINAAIAGLGPHNLMQGATPGHGPVYGAMPPHPLAAPHGNGGNQIMAPVAGPHAVPAGPVTLPAHFPANGGGGVAALIATLLGHLGTGGLRGMDPGFGAPHAQGYGMGAVGGGY